MRFLLMVANTLGVTEGVAAAIVNYIITADSIISIILFVSSILGGASLILTMGWRAFVASVKWRIRQYGMTAAILW